MRIGGFPSLKAISAILSCTFLPGMSKKCAEMALPVLVISSPSSGAEGKVRVSVFLSGEMLIRKFSFS